MKAWLIFLGTPFRKVHDLAELLALLPAEAARQIDVDDLILLNPWTILGRYPDDVSEATVQEGEASAAAAGRAFWMQYRPRLVDRTTDSERVSPSGLEVVCES